MNTSTIVRSDDFDIPQHALYNRIQNIERYHSATIITATIWHNNQMIVYQEPYHVVLEFLALHDNYRIHYNISFNSTTIITRRFKDSITAIDFLILQYSTIAILDPTVKIMDATRILQQKVLETFSTKQITLTDALLKISSHRKDNPELKFKIEFLVP